MKVSGFTFLRNVDQLGFPFIESIRSALPLVDEFIINVGHSEDRTLEKVKAIGDPKIKIIESQWNNCVCDKGFVYAQQKMIAQYSCTGDWALYIEADELLHEQEYEKIREAMHRYHRDEQVEALVFDYLHFYGNIDTYAWSPAWYRRAARLIKTSVRNVAPDGLFWIILDKNRKSRYPRAALANATIYHYGWVRSEEKMQQKLSQVQQYWGKDEKIQVDYRAIDSSVLHQFTGTHPAALQGYFQTDNQLFAANAQHRLTKRERKNRLGLRFEKWFGLELSRKHFNLIKENK